MGGVPGTQCRLAVDWWDGPLPVAGDFLRTAAGTCYLVDEFRRSRAGSKRIGTFICTRLERDAVAFGEPGVFGWEFARRVRGRALSPALGPGSRYGDPDRSCA